MAYGKIKADTIVYDDSGSDVEKTVASLAASAPAASPIFTGDVTINAQGDIRFADSDSSHYVGFQSPATVTTNVVWTLPSADGSNGQQLSTNGSGTLNWTDATNVAAASLSGTTMASNVVTSSLTTVGTLGSLTVSGDVTVNARSDVRFADSDSSNYVALQAPATVGSNVTFTLPAADGSAGQYLKTDASGNLSFGTVDTSTLMPKSGGAFTGAVTSNNTISDSKGDVRSIPANVQSSAYTLVASDAGKFIRATAAITVPNNVFSEGDAVTIVNNSGSDITLTQGISLMYNSADGSTGNRTLAGRGMATILFATANICFISGAGLS